ncbi:MAG: ABC transporter ATP-binding protein [Actinomycetales bacterium]|nr:ABC transporter ATP-binding protein [Actinomycetales bacterium]
MSMMGGGRGRRGGAGRPDKNTPKATFKQLWPYLAQHKGSLILAAVLSLIGAVLSLAQPLLTGQVINAVQKHQPVVGPVALLVTLVVVSGFSGGWMYYVLTRTGEGVVLSARRHLAERLLRLPIKEYDLRRTGDLVSRVSGDTTLLRNVLTQGLVDAVGGLLVFVGSVIAMAVIDPVLLGCTLLVILVAMGAIIVVARQIRSATTKAQERVGAMSAAVERALSAVRTIRAARAEAREAEEIVTDATQAYDQGVKIARISSAISPIAGIAMNGAFIVVLGVGGFRVASGATTVANLVSFVLLLFLMIRPIGQAFGAYSSVQTGLGALARIQEILSIVTEEELSDAPQASVATPVSSVAIEFENVDFAYAPAPAEPASEGEEPAAPAEAKPVLSGVNFKIERGTRVAIVGPSGAGKSTTLSLIERFYEPTAGRILLDGQPVAELDRSVLRAQLGYVEQDAPVLAGSIRANLLIGKPDATDAELRAVLAEVNLTEVLERNERGLDAEVGEQGIMLSGGERQRLAIARTLLAAPPILLLDESTSSLDGLNEQRMREAIDAVAKNRTLIVIAHRLSTVVDSDQIIVMENGTVIGSGTHSELVKTVPLYKELAKHQLLV